MDNYMPGVDIRSRYMYTLEDHFAILMILLQIQCCSKCV